METSWAPGVHVCKSLRVHMRLQGTAGAECPASLVHARMLERVSEVLDLPPGGDACACRAPRVPSARPPWCMRVWSKEFQVLDLPPG